MENLSYLLHLFQKGGLVMYPLVIFSIVSVAIAVERFQYYKHNFQPNDGLVDSIHQALDDQDWNTAVEVCNNFDTVVSRTIKAGLIQASSPE